MFLDIFFCNNIKCSLSHRVQFFKDPSAAYSANIWEFYQRYDKSYWFVPRTVILNVLKLKRDFHEFRLLKGEWFLLKNVELEPILFTVVTISLTKNDKVFPCMSSFTPRFCTHVESHVIDWAGDVYHTHLYSHTELCLVRFPVSLSFPPNRSNLPRSNISTGFYGEECIKLW